MPSSVLRRSTWPSLAVFALLFSLLLPSAAEAHYIQSGNQYYGVQRGVKAYGNASLNHVTGRSDAPAYSTSLTGSILNPKLVDAVAVRMRVQYRATESGTISTCWLSAWQTRRNAFSSQIQVSSVRGLCGRGYYRVQTQARFRVETADPYVTSGWITNGSWHGLL